MTYLGLYLAMLVGGWCTLIALTAMHRREKHNIGKLGWLVLLLLTPPVGLLLFLVFGGKKVSAEHTQRPPLDFPDPEVERAETTSRTAAIAVKRGLSAPARVGFQLLTTPETMHAGLFDLVDSASQRLLLHSFILNDDQVGRQLIDRICQKARAGVEVRLMVDGFGSFFFPKELLRQADEAGAKTARFKPPNRISRFAYSNYRNHRKMVVADGSRALVGGANFVEYEMTPTPDENTWVDYLVKIDGLAARHVEKVFCSDWKFATGDRLPTSSDVSQAMGSRDNLPDATLQMVPVGPDGPDEILDDLWLTAINQADHRVWIMTPYFVPPPAAMRSLAMAVRRGVDVRIMYPDDSDLAIADWAGFVYLQDLHQLGASLLRFPNKMLHAKMLLVDEEVGFVGSPNFDMRSFFLNYELAIAGFGRTTIDQLSSWFESLAQQCLRGPKENTRSRRALSVLARIFAKQL